MRQNWVETTRQPNRTKKSHAWVWGNSSSTNSTWCVSVKQQCQTLYFTMSPSNCAMMSSWKQTLASMASRSSDLELVCTYDIDMRNIVLIWTWPPMYFRMFCQFTSRYSLAVICLHCSKYLSISYLTWFSCLASLSDLTGGILWIFTKTSMPLYNRAYES